MNASNRDFFIFRTEKNASIDENIVHYYRGSAGHTGFLQLAVYEDVSLSFESHPRYLLKLSSIIVFISKFQVVVYICITYAAAAAAVSVRPYYRVKRKYI